MTRYPALKPFHWLAALFLALVLALVLPTATPGQTDVYSYRLQQGIDQLNAELEFYEGYRLDEPGMMSIKGEFYNNMTGRFIDAEIVTMPQAEFLRIATEYWAFASDEYLAQGLNFNQFIKTLYTVSDGIRGELREQVASILNKRDELISQLGQMNGNPPRNATTVDGWAGRWALTRTQVTGHVSSSIGPVYETVMVVRIRPDGNCRADIQGFDVVICRLGSSELYLESSGGWAGDSTFSITRNGDRLTGTFFSWHPNSGEATGRLDGERVQ